MSRPPVKCGADGRIVEGPEEILGLLPEKVGDCVKALDELARRRPQKTAVMAILYRRGWISARGDITTKGERFRDGWRGVKWVTRPVDGAISCHHCGESCVGRPAPADGHVVVPPEWLAGDQIALCSKDRCARAFGRAMDGVGRSEGGAS